MPGGAREPGRPGHPGPPRGAAVSVRACVTARRRSAWSPGPGRPSPAAERILPGGSWGLSRTRLIPRSSQSPRGARRLRAVRAIGARRDPAPVRQPVLAAGHRPAVHRAPVHRAAAVQAPVAGRAVRREAVSRACRRRREAARRAGARAVRLVEARLGRPFSRSPQQLAVLVVGAIRPVRARAVLRPVGAAVTQASSPGHAVGIAAQAGVATFHQVPPGRCCPAAPQDLPYLMSVGREKSPVGPRRPIVINCT